jgi:riboflavin kinase / FMN adenylyltransferase
VSLVRLNEKEWDFTSGSVVTLGNFDGLHRGHQQLLQRARQRANDMRLPVVVITFQPLPQEYFSSTGGTVRLQRLSEKLPVMSEWGVDAVLCLHFNDFLAQLSPEGFVKTFLVDKLAVRHLVIGDDFRFGAKRAGDFDVLRQLGECYQFEVEQLPTFLQAGERVSSSRVRLALAQGDCLLAQELLGRAYSITARVIYGDQRGREWGFPTANMPLFRLKPPLQGVFIVRIQGKDFSAEGVASIGFRPVFKLKRPLLEVFIFDFDRDIYGQRLRVEFVQKIRDEADFESVEALKLQIKNDVKLARDYFLTQK